MTDLGDSDSYLAIVPWDLEQWFASDTYNGQPLEVQAAYRNLCDRAFQRQPYCTLPDDDATLWKLAGCASLEQWRALKPAVFGAGGWTLGVDGWTHPTVLEKYAGSSERHMRAVRAGRIAGKASARVRREVSKRKEHRTVVERPSTKDRSTTVNPPSPSPSPSPSDGRNGRKEEPACPQVPPEQRAEEATDAAIHRLQLELGSWVCKLAEHPNSRQMVPAWTRAVTSYETRDGTRVRGVPDYRTVHSIDRLEKSIEDAKWWHGELEKGKVVDGTR